MKVSMTGPPDLWRRPYQKDANCYSCRSLREAHARQASLRCCQKEILIHHSRMTSLCWGRSSSASTSSGLRAWWQLSHYCTAVQGIAKLRQRFSVLRFGALSMHGLQRVRVIRPHLVGSLLLVMSESPCDLRIAITRFRWVFDCSSAVSHRPQHCCDRQNCSQNPPVAAT